MLTRWLPTSATALAVGGRNPAASESSARAQNEDIQHQLSLVYLRIDRYFVRLMLLQWAAAIVLALWVRPLPRAGNTSSLPPHLALALLYGGALTLVPVYLARIAPGRRVTRLTIAVMQMLMSSLLIHLSGGRIETHFHIFGSLAFLAF